MSTLPEILTSPQRRPAAVQALTDVVQDEVRGKSGVGGMALKAGFAAATKIRPDLVPHAVERLLPDFAERLEPYWQGRNGQPFGEHLRAHGDQVADDLLAVTDERVAQARPAIAKIYGGLRPKAKTQVVDALPRLGGAIESLAG